MPSSLPNSTCISADAYLAGLIPALQSLNVTLV
jgi:hypothetical protein